MTDETLSLAEAFLQETVFRSRAQQAATSSLPGEGSAVAGSGRCGLGERAAVELDLSERGEKLCRELWPAGLEAPAQERVRAAMRAWIELQDVLDRKRNHFLKAFRREHGFVRRAYTDEQAQAFEAGLETINAEVRLKLAAAARELLESAN